MGSQFNDLWNAHVTESGVLVLAIAFGWVAAIAFLLAPILSLAGRRSRLMWPCVLLAILTGELAYGMPLNGFLGAILFYGCLLFVICDETRLST